MENQVSKEHLRKYLNTTREALDKLTITCPERSFGRRLAEDFLKMAKSYYQDALHFEGSGDHVNAFACVNYAHGWLDCGARLGLFDVGDDDRLFTLYE
ncbi:MAG: DUF357 domain-containing protein [Methanomassiliicoccales archaeon]